MKNKEFSFGAWSRSLTQAMVAALVLTAAERVSAEEPDATASSEEAPPPPERVPLIPLRGKQVTVFTKNGVVKGKLVEMSNISAVIEKDGGARVTVARDEITAARLRFTPAPPPARDSPVSVRSGSSPGADKGVDADKPADAGEDGNAQERVFGIGSAFGGGFSAASAVSGAGDQASLVAPALLLPTMELQIFFPREYSLDMVVPLTNMIIASRAVDGFVMTMDAFFNMNVGQGTERFVFGPGLGFSVLASERGSAATFRLPAQLGVEVLTMKRGFGFKVLARPWAEFGSGTAATVAGGGLLGALVFSTYVTRDKPVTTASR